MESTVVDDFPGSSLAAALLECEECGRPWLEQRERWRLYLTDDHPPRLVPYCSECASREFDPGP